MNPGELFDALQLHHNQIFDHQIHSVTQVRWLPHRRHRATNLGLHCRPCLRNSCVRQASYALSSSPVQSAEWTFIAAVTIQPLV